jgi:hypothetical protein
MLRMADVLSPPVGSSSPPRSIDPLRLMAIAVALPGVVALVDYALLSDEFLRQGGLVQVCLQFFWYLLQVGVISYAVGRGVTQPLLRWFVFAWILLLVDLISLTLALRGGALSEPFLIPAALIAGQIGLCVVWATLGDGRWPLRAPAMAFVAAAVFWVWHALRPPHSVRIWTELLVLQVATLSLLCGLLRWRGFRLRVIAAEETTAADGAEMRQLQFNIKHVLMWTTASAMFLGIAKALDLLTWESARELAAAGSFWKLTVAAASAMVIIVALWVALGRGNVILRYSVGLVFATAVGAGLAVWSNYMVAAAAPLVPWSFAYWELRRWYEVGAGWLGWLFLSGGLLAATLMILRTLGYRLMRQRPRPGNRS